MLDSPGERFWDPAADGACFEAIKQGVHAGVTVQELDHNINDPEFSGAAAQALLEMLAGEKKAYGSS